jgi:hypothetical protein
MDFQHCEVFDTLDRLRESARRGDWRNAEVLAAGLTQHAVPRNPAGLEEYLRLLKDTLVVARAWRAHAAASLVRINAAAKFSSIGRDMSRHRQNSADSANF